MKKYKYLLWDLDDTILDFKVAEKNAIRALFEKFGFGECSDDMIQQYSNINVRYWQMLERGEMSKPDILVGRFKEFFSLMNLDISKAEDFNAAYQLALGDTLAYHDNALDILNEQKGHYTLVAITNGTKDAQDKKLSRSGLDKVFDYIFISEVVGAEKPSVSFFNHVIKEVGIEDLSQALIIGDSLTSDIRGGNNIGIDTCWYNFKGATNDQGVHITYEINNLSEITEILNS